MPRTPLLGCIADDLTGATDLAGGLVREGMRVTLAVGVPDESSTGETDALVVALKSRSIPAAAAVAQARRARSWLSAAGVERIYFKYASTFDSTDDGNIGPVTEALQADLGVIGTVACPAFPANGRTVRDGLLLVDGRPISETHMQHHPLNPMRDADLRRVLAAQTAGDVGHLPLEAIRGGSGTATDVLERLRSAGCRHVIADGTTDEDLDVVAEVVLDDLLVTGASALAAALARKLRTQARFERAAAQVRPPIDGPAAVVAGSCSTATLEQVEAMAARRPTHRIDVAAVTRDEDEAGRALAWARDRLSDGPILIASSAARGSDARVPDAVGAAIERTLATTAAGLVGLGVRRLVVAGGETSGAVVQALGLRVLDVGDEIEPGVPWVVAHEPVELGLVLKSGNFGGPDFFERALEP